MAVNQITTGSEETEYSSTTYSNFKGPWIKNPGFFVFRRKLWVQKSIGDGFTITYSDWLGSVVEWSMALALNPSVLKSTVSSNLTASASVVEIQHPALTNKTVDATIELNKATKSIETVAKIFKNYVHVVLFAGTIWEHIRVTRPVRGIGRSELAPAGVHLLSVMKSALTVRWSRKAADRLAVMTVVTWHRKPSRTRSTMVPKCFFIWWVHLEA